MAMVTPKREKTHPMAVQRRFLRQQGVKRPVILDVGARIGQITEKYLRAMPNATAHAIEPDPQACVEFAEKWRQEKRVTLTQRALGSYAGSADLYLHGGGTNSLLLRAGGRVYYPPHRRSKKSVAVRIDTLDRLAKAKGWSQIDILKMDVQGSELEVLKGASATLAGVRLIFTEVMFTPIYDGGPMYHHIAAFLEEAGFRLFSLYFLSNAVDGQLRQSDALFVNTRYESKEAPQ